MNVCGWVVRHRKREREVWKVGTAGNYLDWIEIEQSGLVFLVQ